MDQVHAFAANQHREFVIEHLQPWLQYAEKRDSDRFGEIMRLLALDQFPEDPPKPQWFKIKEKSIKARTAKAANTCLRNRLKTQVTACVEQSTTLQKRRTSMEPNATNASLPRRSARLQNKVNQSQPTRPRGPPPNRVVKSQSKRSRGQTKKAESTPSSHSCASESGYEDTACIVGELSFGV